MALMQCSDFIDSGQFKPMQLATVAALRNMREWHYGMNRIYAERRLWAEKIMDLLNCGYDKSQVGLFVWGKLQEQVVSSKDFIDDILYNACVFITPGVIFGSNGEEYIRISLGASVEKMKKAYNRISTYNNDKKYGI